MKVGIDLSSLQSAHRKRGIGYTLINFVNGMSQKERSENVFIFFVLPDGSGEYDSP